jgi:glycosyltransferase involved in cell wall biosynthesis
MILYITYDGVLDPLGQSQVIPYLLLLARGRKFYLLSYEKPDRLADRAAVDELRSRLRNSGIEWTYLRFHKTPAIPATCYDIFAGICHAIAIVFQGGAKVIHARSLISALIALPAKVLLGRKLLFDIRGFWVDCRRDQGLILESSLLYRALKVLERLAYANSDAVTALTRRAAAQIRGFEFLKTRKLIVAAITTCVDLDLFQPSAESPIPISKVFTLGYVGSVGPLYLFDETLDCFRVLRELRPDARLLIVNQGGHGKIRAALERKAIPHSLVDLESSDYRLVPGLIRKMSAAVCFVLPTASMAAAAPTKIGEYLASGVPVIANTHPGDLEDLLADSVVGVGLREFSRTSYEHALRQLLRIVENPLTKIRCRDRAERGFSLERGVSAYAAIYRRLGGS